MLVLRKNVQAWKNNQRTDASDVENQSPYKHL